MSRAFLIGCVALLAVIAGSAVNSVVTRMQARIVHAMHMQSDAGASHRGYSRAACTQEMRDAHVLECVSDRK